MFVYKKGFRMSDTDLNKSVEDATDEPNERTPLLTGGGPVYNTPRELIESCSLSQYVKTSRTSPVVISA